VNTSLWARWRGSFLTGLAVILPGVLTLAVIKWLFGTIAIFTDSLLFFLPWEWTHQDGSGPMFWYWSVAAFVMGVALVTLVGLLARNFIGRRIIATGPDVKGKFLRRCGVVRSIGFDCQNRFETKSGGHSDRAKRRTGLHPLPTLRPRKKHKTGLRNIHESSFDLALLHLPQRGADHAVLPEALCPVRHQVRLLR
jgi:uncharacterized membrane protein